MKGFRLQPAQVVIRIAGKGYLGTTQGMFDFTYTASMVIAIGIDFRARGLPACRVRMCHRGRIVGKGIGRRSHVITAQKITLHSLHHTPLDVVVVGCVKLRTAAQNGYHAPCKKALPVARRIKDERTGRGKIFAADSLQIPFYKG